MMEAVKNYKQMINEHCQREKWPKAAYVCTPDREGNPNGFFCTLTVGEQSFCTPNWQKTKKSAEFEAAKIACEKFDLSKTASELKKELKKEVPSTNGVNGKETDVAVKPKPVKDPDWITIEKVEDIYKYLTDEVLAQEFKAFLHCKAQEEKKGYPEFETVAKDKGFTSTVTYDGVGYSSLGVMMSKKQAEQSAAEVCLRTLGDFPNVTKDKYTIQVYRGGQVHIATRKLKESNSKYTYSLLQSIIASLGHQFPHFCYKEVAKGETEAASTKSLCYFEGKTFESSECDSIIDAKCLAAAEALKLFGYDEATSKAATELRDVLRLKKRRAFVPLGVLMSPYIYSPSKRPTWVFYHYDQTEQVSGVPVTAKDLEFMFDSHRLKNAGFTSEKVMEMIFERTPAIESKPLHECTDVSVCELIKEDDKPIALIGNEKASFPMFCEGGKIRCENRSCEVELLPGHNIRGLKCSFQLQLPSLQVYLKAESCDDLFYPNRPLPVVESCGVVAMMFDHEASVQEIQILLTRPTDFKSFAVKARHLSFYLHKLISGSQAQSRFNVAKCTANITSWTRKEVELLGEMTMDSMRELLSPYVRYDERWNEIFAKDEHPDVLKELEDACSAELSRRTEECVEEPQEEENKAAWTLPTSRYRHRLLQTGILVENEIMCTFRTLLEATGLKIKLGELEVAPTVDLPNDTTKTNRGDVCRYTLWTGLRKVSGDEEEPYYKGKENLKNHGDDWMVDVDVDGKRSKENKSKRKAKERNRQNNKRPKMNDNQESPVKIEEDDEKPPAAEGDTEQAPPAEEEKKTGGRRRLFIANLPRRDVTEEDLKKYFDEIYDPNGEIGYVESVEFVKRKEKGKLLEENKGFGFITASSEELADEMALNHSSFDFGGRTIELKKSVATAERTTSEPRQNGPGWSGAKESKSIQSECRWFPLEEAKELCPTLARISSNAQFLSQVQTLQTDATAFMKEKSNTE